MFDWKICITRPRMGCTTFQCSKLRDQRALYATFQRSAIILNAGMLSSEFRKKISNAKMS